MQSATKRKRKDETTSSSELQEKKARLSEETEKSQLSSNSLTSTVDHSSDNNNLSYSNNNLNNNNNDDDMSWGYDKENGPATWAKNFPDAGGPRQSPVDINPQKATYSPDLAKSPLVINYNNEASLQLENPGLSFKANITADSVISGGPLGSAKYKLVQFHFHWAQDDSCGSEHTVAGKTYPSELHLVHYNTDKYKSFGDAVTQPDGLAVIGVFIKVGSNAHKGFQTLAANAGKVKCKASKCDTGVGFNPASLLPGNTKNYWTYEGSLTTPPCCESVRWIVLQEEITVSQEQIQAMRNLCCDDCGDKKIPNNYRPPLGLGKRSIQASFQ